MGFDLQTAIDGLDALVFVIDAEYRVRMANRAARKALGIVEEPVGELCYQVVCGTSSPCSGSNECPLPLVAECRKPVTALHAAPDAPTGSPAVRVTASPLLGPDGRLEGIIEMRQDASVSEAEALCQAIVEAFEGFVYVASGDYRIVYANAALVDHLGAEVVGRYCYQAIHDLDEPCPWCQDLPAFVDERTSWDAQWHQTGRWYHVLSGPVRLADGTRAKQTVLIDITDRKRTEQGALEHQQRLRSLVSRWSRLEQTERGELSRRMHDSVCQTLAAATMGLGLANRAASAWPEQRSLEKTHDLVRQAADETRALMNALRPPMLDVLGLGPAVEQLVAGLQAERGLSIELEVRGPAPPVPPALGSLIHRAIEELLVNVAVHSGAPSARVAVTFGEEQVTVQVSDEGVGFDAKQVMLDVHGRESFGILDVAERLCALGGQLDVRSAPGEGTMVILVAPLRVGPEEGDA